MKQSAAGLLLYRKTPQGLEVLLVHPSGAYNRKAPWGIPKGEIDGEETIEQAARRETLEETGLTTGEVIDLGSIDYKKSRKRIFCFAGEAPPNGEPRCASWEIDQASFVSLEKGREIIHPDQAAFLDRLVELFQLKTNS